MNAIKATKEEFIAAAEKAGWTYQGQDGDLLMFHRDDALYGVAWMSAEVLNEKTVWGDESVAEFL